MKGGGRDAEFALESFIGGLDNRWRDYILVGEWRSMQHKYNIRRLSGLKDSATG